MRNSLYFIGSIAVTAIALASCNKEQSIIEPDIYEYTFAVSNGDANSASAETKALLASDENGLFLKWESTDKLNTWAFVSEGSYSYNNQSSVDVSTNPVTFTIKSYQKLAKDATVYCSYPYVELKTVKTPIASLEIPEAQTQNGNDFTANAMPMVANPFPISNAITETNGTSSETDAVKFYNLGGIIEFDIYSPSGAYATETISSVIFNAGETAIAGSFDFDLTGVNASNPSTLSISGKGYDKTSVTTSVSGLSVGSATSVATAQKVYMVVAPGSYTGTVTVKTSAASYTYTISSAKQFDRAQVKRLGINLESTTCDREQNGYEVPVTIDFKEQTNVGYVEITGADYYAKNSSYFFGSTLRFDATDEQIIIPTKTAFGDISIVALYNTSSTPTSALKIYGSSDGDSYTEIGTPSFTHGTNVADTPDAVVVSNTNNTYRYIKMVFTKATGNLALGSISLAAPDTDPRIEANDIEGVLANGANDAEASYSVFNFTDDVEVSNVTGCVSDALAMDGEIVYSVTPNYTGAVRTGTIVLASVANPSVTKTINVSQEADVFSVSVSSVKVGKAAGATETFTITSTYDFTVASSDTDVFTVSPTSGTGGANPQTITVTVIAGNDAAEKPLGTVTITRTVDDNDELEVAISQQAGTYTPTEQTLYSDAFKAPSKASDWSTDLSAMEGVSSVIENAAYTMTSVRVSKNGELFEGNTDSNAGVVVLGPLAVADCEDLIFTFDWKPGSIKGTYSTKLEYATSSTGTYAEVSNSSTSTVAASSYADRKYVLPEAAQVSTLYIKITFNTSNTQAYIDNLKLVGKK